VAASGVAELSATGTPSRIAFLERNAREPCGVVRAWLLSPRLVRRVSPPCRQARSRLYGLTGGHEQIAWASRSRDRQETLWYGHYNGITDRYSPARAVARTPQRSALVMADGGDSAIGYAIGRRITYLTNDGTRDYRSSWTLASAPVRLATDSAYLATQEANGNVSIFLQGAGPNDPVPASRFSYPPGQIDALKIAHQTLALLRGRELEVRPIYGTRSQTFRLAGAATYGDDHCGRPSCPNAALRLADLDGNLAVYVAGSTLHVLRVFDGRDVVIRSHLGDPIHAELQPTGLCYSAASRVFFVPRRAIARALAR
jgi:hypothetical protein